MIHFETRMIFSPSFRKGDSCPIVLESDKEGRKVNKVHKVKCLFIFVY